MILSVSIPADSDLLIKKGDMIEFGSPLYKGKITKDVKVPLANILKISSKKIFTVLKKFVGEEVKKGDVVAFHAGMFTRRRYVSEHDGVIREVNHSEGYLIIESDTEESLDQTAWFTGEVETIEKDNNNKSLKIGLKVKETTTIDARHISENFGGKIIVLNGSSMQTISEEDIDDAVVVAEDLQSFEQVKLEALGARGIITSHPPKEEPSLPFAVLEKPEDIKKFHPAKLPYCLTDKHKGTIHTYSL